MADRVLQQMQQMGILKLVFGGGRCNGWFIQNITDLNLASNTGAMFAVVR